MNADDVLIGRNVVTYRGDQSQTDVAAAMKARGWKWAQNTVSAIEAGERPLRLAEAADLAHVLGLLSVDELTRENEYVLFRRTAGEMTAANEALEAAVEAYQNAQVSLAIMGDIAAAAGVPPTNGFLAPLESWLTVSATEAVAASIRRDSEPESTDEEIAQFKAANARAENGGYWINLLLDTNVRSRGARGEHSEEA
jgi:hypothetical protein